MDAGIVLDHIDLRNLAEEAGAQFRGQALSSACPLHGGSNPSAFHLYRGADGRQRWHCFTNCPHNANDGDAIAFYMRWQRTDFKEALAALARRAGLDLTGPAQKGAPMSHAVATPRPVAATPPAGWTAAANAFARYAHDQLYQHPPILEEYLMADRGLTRETIMAWTIGYNPADLRRDPARWGLSNAEKHVWCARGVTIPTVVGGQIVQVNVRRPLPSDALAALAGPVAGLPEVKYAAVRGGVRRLFGADYLSGKPVCVVTEGEFDCLLLWQECGDLVDVCTIGGAGQKLRPEDAVHLLRARRILVAYDTDQAGQSGAAALAALSERVARVPVPAKDITDLWRQSGIYGLRLWLRAAIANNSGGSSWQ